MTVLHRSRPRHPDAPTRGVVAARLLVAALLAVSLVGCGSGDDERSTTTTVDGGAWVADLAADCESLNDEFARLADADPTDRTEAVRYAEDVDAFAEAMVAVLDDAATRASDGAGDADDARTLDDLVELTGELEAATTELADAATAGDAPAVDAAAAEVTRLGQRINPLADDLGVGDCGGF